MSRTGEGPRKRRNRNPNEKNPGISPCALEVGYDGGDMDTSASPRTVTGRVDVHPRGFGFLTVQKPGAPEVLSAFITPPDLNPLFAGDVVNATVTASGEGRWTASGLSLVERTRTVVYGEVVSRRGSFFLRIDKEVSNTEWPLDPGTTPVQPNDAVVARIADGKVVLLYKLEPGADRSLERVIARHGLHRDFPQEVVAEALRAREVPHALGTRRDLRAIPTVTVDAPSTRDIDDAISVLPAGPDGAVRLLVSIADVGESVKEGSALDLEARARATSVYLAGRVLPMLPEELSSNWLSLVPDQERHCLTVELRIDPDGRVTSADVYESLIRSWARLNYDEVAEFLDDGTVSSAMESVREAMPWFRLAAARLAVSRAARGGMVMSRDEARFTFDTATGAVSGLAGEKDTSAHGMIERFMVAANEAIAMWLMTRGVPTVFRVHEQPDPQRVADVNAFALHSGFAAGFGAQLTPLALAAFDRQISGAKAEAALRSVLRRSLGPSRYTVKPGPHFGLAAPLYLHFTSPIRRYADLAVHRLIKAYLQGRRDFVHEDPEVELLSQHINLRARSANRAEVDRHHELEARFMATRIGQQFPARIVRVKPFGLVAQLDGMWVEGMVPADGLAGGPYRPDARELSMVGAKRTFTVGMPVKVKVVSTDEQLGRVEFSLVE